MSLPTKWAQNNGVHCDASLPLVVMRTDVGPSRILCFSDHHIPISDRSRNSGPAPNKNSTERPIAISDMIYYFEIEILSNVNEGGTAEISVGIAPVDRQVNLSGMRNVLSFRDVAGSVSYSNTGEISVGDKACRAVKFGTHDVVGCGCEIGGDGRIFFTCNGKVITEQNNAFSIDVNLIDQMFYYPAVEILGVGTTVRANFGGEKFQYDVGDPLFYSNNLPVSQMPSVGTGVGVEKIADVVPPPILGHAQSHSFISRISSQLSQPLFFHSQSDPSCKLSRNDTKELNDLELQSEDYLVAIASAISLEPTDTVISSLDVWTDNDYTQAMEALQLLRELVESRPAHTDQHKTEGHSVEVMGALCDTLTELQGRLRRSIDKSPENESLLELNDMITEILLEVAELGEVIGGNDDSLSLPKVASSGVSGSTNPSLVSIMYMLRRGTKEEVLGSVSQILLKCNLEENECFSPSRSPTATKSINDIRVAGGLQTLVSTLHRCVNWPDVELQISLAIAILVSYETDWHILMKESHAVLSSMQVLLLRKNEIQFSMNCGDVENHKEKLCCLVSSAVRRFCALLYTECLKPNMKASTMSSLQSESDNLSESPLEVLRMSAKSSMMAPATDEAYLCRTLETLVHIIQTLCEDSVHDPTDAKNARTKSENLFELSTSDQIVQTSTNSYELCSANCGSEKDDITDIHTHISSSETLTRSRSTPDLNYPANNYVEKKMDLNLAVNESSLSNNINQSQGRTRSSSLNAIFSSCDSGTVSCLVDDVVILCSQSVRDLCQIEDFHASLVAGDILLLLVKWLSDSTIILRTMLNSNSLISQSCRSSVDHPVIELVNNVTAALVSITAPNSSSISSSTSPEIPGFRRSNFNQKQSNYTIGWIDAQVMAVELPVALVAFIDLLAKNNSFDSFNKKQQTYFCYEKLGGDALVTSLISLASRSQNRASLLSCGAPYSVLRLLAAVISRRKYISLNTPKEGSEGTGKYEGESVAEMQHITDFNESLAGKCLDFVSIFLADLSKSAIADKPPDLVNFFMQPPVFNSLVNVFSFQPCLARLQAVRVLSMLVEWQQVMELLYEEGISTALSVLLEDANERYEYEMINRDDELSKLGSLRIDNTASSRPSSSRYVLEETMRSCYTLAHLCHSKLSYALQCFESGLMTIMLRTLRHDHIEVQRQSIRCISGMCPVLSVLTPGAHPSLMIASLKSESSNINPARSQSGSVTETRAIAKKLHGNVIDFVNALRALTDALSSPNMLIKMEALRGISHLAKDDHLRVGIVEGPLSLIIALLLDPQCETDLQQLAESVLVNIGFVGGRDDLAVVCNDPYLLSEWFYIRRSLRLQKSCHDLLHQWIDGCFFGCDVAEKRAKQLYIAELGREAALAENVDDEDSLFLHFPEGIDIDIRDTVDLVGLSVVTNVIEKIVGKRKHQQDITLDVHDTSLPLTAPQQSTDLRDALLLQFTHLFDAWKLLRNQHMSTSTLNLPSDVFPSISSNEWIKDKSENYFSFSPGASGKKKTSGHITERFFAFMTLCTGRGAQRVVDEENEEAYKLDKFADDKLKSHSMERDDRSLNISNYDYSLNDLDDRLNFPPPKVSECLDLFFPSKLHQSVVCDLFSIGIPSDRTLASTLQSNVLSTPPRIQHLDHTPHRIPEPKQFRCVVFPSRTYFSFAREGK